MLPRLCARDRRALLAVGVGLAVWWIGAGAASAYTSGAVEKDGLRGCAPCHGNVENSAALDHIEGFPRQYRPGATYSVTVRVGIPDERPVGPVRGGFAADVDAGRLQPTDDRTHLANQTITQTTMGAHDLAWSFQWIAPSRAPATTLRLHVTALGHPNREPSTEANDVWVRDSVVAFLPFGEAKASTAPKGHSAALGAGAATAACVTVAALLTRRR